MTELRARRPQTHSKQIDYYDKMAEAMITQKNLEVDLNLQNVGADMIAMLKGEKQTEDSSNRDFSEDDTLFHLGGGGGGEGGEEGGKITLLQKKLKI